ncbi:GNAT family N-acetyltransferase [Stenotrophomonas maltophilia]|uniref:GNAT family N-acetyltransferase n=1 Tax=Stenotrophomonas maltophilia TaxID=40324 RepID=UPI001E3607DA|nr:GNAT family protein [Stenotrophomonas maltophilia]
MGAGDAAAHLDLALHGRSALAQGRGIGRRALEVALAQIRDTPGLAEIEICYNPRNPVAGAFYGSFGFVETGMDDDGEDMLAVLPVTPPE